MFYLDVLTKSVLKSWFCVKKKVMNLGWFVFTKPFVRQVSHKWFLFCLVGVTVFVWEMKNPLARALGGLRWAGLSPARGRCVRRVFLLEDRWVLVELSSIQLRLFERELLPGARVGTLGVGAFLDCDDE